MSFTAKVWDVLLVIISWKLDRRLSKAPWKASCHRDAVLFENVKCRDLHVRYVHVHMKADRRSSVIISYVPERLWDYKYQQRHAARHTQQPVRELLSALICSQWISSCEGFTVNVTECYWSVKVVNTASVTDCTIFGHSCPAVIQLCVLSSFIVCALTPSGFRQRLLTGFRCLWLSDSNLRLFVSRDGTTALSGIRLGNRWEVWLHLSVSPSLPPLCACPLISAVCVSLLFLFSFCHIHLTLCTLEF